jgi:hypothetical protein
MNAVFQGIRLPPALCAALILLYLVYRLLRPALIATTLPRISANESKRIVRSAVLLVSVLVGVMVLIFLGYMWLSREPSTSTAHPETATTIHASLPI